MNATPTGSVEVFTEQREAPGYSRMVPLTEIVSETNYYNLNITRYIDSNETEDLHDLAAHLHGGIPEPQLVEADVVRSVVFARNHATVPAMSRTDG